MTPRSIVLTIVGLAAGAASLGGGLWAQVPANTAAGQAAGAGIPAVVILEPTAQDRADLAVARQAPGAARAASVAARAQQSPAARAIAASPVPVLLPWTSPGMTNVKVSVRGLTYAASLEEPGRAISIFGTKQAFRPPGATPAPAPSPAPSPPAPGPAAAREMLKSVIAKAPSGLQAQLGVRPAAPPTTPAGPRPPSNVRYQRTESGIDVSFIRFGAAYDLSLVCPDMENDPRCNQAAAKAVVDSLAVAGGGAGW